MYQLYAHNFLINTVLTQGGIRKSSFQEARQVWCDLASAFPDLQVPALEQVLLADAVLREDKDLICEMPQSTAHAVFEDMDIVRKEFLSMIGVNQDDNVSGLNGIESLFPACSLQTVVQRHAEQVHKFWRFKFICSLERIQSAQDFFAAKLQHMNLAKNKCLLYRNCFWLNVCRRYLGTIFLMLLSFVSSFVWDVLIHMSLFASRTQRGDLLHILNTIIWDHRWFRLFFCLIFFYSLGPGVKGIRHGRSVSVVSVWPTALVTCAFEGREL